MERCVCECESNRSESELVLGEQFSMLPLHCAGEELLGTSANPFVPLEVIGAMDNDGLGCTDWWTPADDSGMDE